jgi:hypothetical protein
MTPPENGTLGGTSARELSGSARNLDEVSEFARHHETSPELRRFLAEIKGQAQFLLYLADQIEESLEQLAHETDHCHSAFLCKILGMYSSQLETKHQGLGEKIAEACQEVYVTVREHELVTH